MSDLSRREALLLTAGAVALIPAAARGGEPALSKTWDLSELYPSDAAWSAERDAVAKAMEAVTGYKGRLGESATTFRTALQTLSDLHRRTDRLNTYASLKADEDLQVAVNQERRQLGVALDSQLGEVSAWVAPEILAVGADKIHAFQAADPGLAKFRTLIDDTLRQAPHTLSPEGEAVLAAAANTLAGPQEIRSQLVLSDIPWPEVTLSTGAIRLDNQGYTVARQAPNREDRKKVMEVFFGAYKTYESSLGAALSTQVQADIFLAKTRHYPSALESSLSVNNVPVAVYKTLVAEVDTGLPVLHRYFDLRRRMLGLPDIGYYDIYPPVTKLDRRFDLAETRALVLQAVKPLGPDYVDTLAKATAARWADVYPRKGKASGAYMNPGAYDVHPYLLLNHGDDFEGLTTYAHEWGHAMHTVLTTRAQPYDMSNYPIFLAEIASTCNEHLLNDMMIRQAKTRDEKLYYLDRECELIRGTFYRQTMFAEFELAMHETAEKGEALSGAKLSEIYLGILRRYHGPKMIIEPVHALEWAYPPHFYYNFYLYQYATCVVASNYFAGHILKGAAKARDSYLDVLRAGGSDYPTDILKRAGLDMTTPEPYRALIAKFAATLDQMEALVGKA